MGKSRTNKVIEDKQLGIFISEKILVAGIQYQEQKRNLRGVEPNYDNMIEILKEKLRDRVSYGIDFESSHIKYFIDEFFLKI